MTAKAEAIQHDAKSLVASALELAIVDHEELEVEAQFSHAITACLLAAVDMATNAGVESERVEEHLLDLLRVAVAIRRRDMN